MRKASSAAKPYFQSFHKNNHLLWTAVMALELAQVPLALAIAWCLGAVIDAVSSGEMSSLIMPAVISLIVVIANAAICASLEALRANYIRRALTQYKSFAFRKLAEKRISAFSKECTGRYISVFTNDINTIEKDYLTGTFRIVFLLLLFVSSIVMMFFYSPLLTAATLGLTVLPVTASILTGGKLVKKTKEVSDRNESFVAEIKDLLNGFSVIKSFKAEKETAELFDKANHILEKAKRSCGYTNGFVRAAGETGGILLQFGIFIIGAALAIRGDIMTGTVVVFIQMINYITQPISEIPQLSAGRAAAKGLIEKFAEITSENVVKSGEAIEPGLDRSIELKGLSFAYEKDKYVLNNVSMKFERGKKYAIVGASGSGKSTVLNLLMGAYSGYEGSLTIDGKEINTIDPDSLYELFSLIDQNVFLFDDTIQHNITMFRDFPAEKFEAAKLRSGLSELIGRKGSDYKCGENGANLSGGEKQRISIARCLLRETPVLMLDEATAALDNETAFAITDAILSLEGLTRLVVTHRLEKTLLEKYDGIFVMKNGSVCEQGTFSELMESAGYFYSLYNVSN